MSSISSLLSGTVVVFVASHPYYTRRFVLTGRGALDHLRVEITLWVTAIEKAFQDSPDAELGCCLALNKSLKVDTRIK